MPDITKHPLQRPHGDHHALLALDLEHFRQIDDRHRHTAGGRGYR